MGTVVKNVFGNGSLHDELIHRQQQAQALVVEVPAERILQTEAEVIDEIVERFRLHPVSVDWTGKRMDDVAEVRGATPGQEVSIFVPTVPGPTEVWSYRPSEFDPSGTAVHLLDDGDLTFKVRGAALTAESVGRHIARKREMIEKLVDQSRRDVEAGAQSLRSAVAQHVSQRRDRLKKNSALQSLLDIPLRSTSPQMRIEVPVQRQRIRLSERDHATASGSAAEDHLSEAIYEDVLRTIMSLGNALERLPRTSARFNEEELRDLILFILNSNYEGAVRGEVFNGAGKTDLLLPWKDRNAFVGECKVWSGPKKFRDGMNQLLNYTIWRDTKAAVIVFVKTGQPTSIIGTADEVIRQHPCFVRSQAPAEEAASRRDYVLHHPHDSERLITTALLVVPIPSER